MNTAIMTTAYTNHSRNNRAHGTCRVESQAMWTLSHDEGFVPRLKSCGSEF